MNGVLSITAGNRHRSLMKIAVFFPIAIISSCYSPAYVHEPVAAPARIEAAETRLDLTQVYFYPKRGQTLQQQDRDRYECYNWAVRQTGFDPTVPWIAPEHRVAVVPTPPPGHDTAVGLITGAVIGAIAGGPRHAGAGAVIGGAIGGMAGAASDSARQETANQIQQSYTRQDRARYMQFERKALDYRRAMSACLEGRGYSVQ